MIECVTSGKKIGPAILGDFATTYETRATLGVYVRLSVPRLVDGSRRVQCW